MTKKQPRISDREFIARIDDLFEQIPMPETKAEIEEVLREYGYEPAEVANRIWSSVRQTIKNMRFDAQ